MDGNDQLDLDLDLEHNDDDLESDLLSDSEDRAGSAEDFQRSPILKKKKPGPKLENTNLLHSSAPVEFFKLFITDDFVTKSKMAELTNFYAV